LSAEIEVSVLGVSMLYKGERALELLRLGTNNPIADFREGQEDCIKYIVEGRGRLLVVQKTGWGKSFVYFIATILLREANQGVTLLISPLLALMRNQIEAARRMGIRAVTINSSNTEEWKDVERSILANEADIILISPERLANEHFRDYILNMLAPNVAMLVIDEAHCISDWGHDFRPHYRLIERITRNLPQGHRLMATTATANQRVIDDLENILGPNIQISRGDLNRPNLTLQTMRLPNQADRLAWLAEFIPQMQGSGIIYTLTIRDTEIIRDWLKSKGINAESYSGQSGAIRIDLEQQLLNNEVKVLVATTALGMGFDKPDLAFVIHYQTPGSVIAYYQQVGRAGRAIDAAYGILLSGDEELEITDYFIDTAFPERTEVDKIIGALRRSANGLSLPALARRVNIPLNRIEKAISLLSLESPSPIVKVGTRWVLTPTNLSEEFWNRAERLTELRRQEQQQMQEYVVFTTGHMNFLITALDGEPVPDAEPLLPLLPSEVNPVLVREAVTFLKRTGISIEPRKLWPSGGMTTYGLHGNIPLELRASNGRALCYWGDAGWGALVKKGKYTDNHYDDELAVAAAEMIRRWNPQPAPTWVTCVPSLRHPELVPDFAIRVAEELCLPFEPVLTKTDDRPQQKTMKNWIQQALNLDGSLSIGNMPHKGEPVLLIDDMIDSRWTLTVAAWLLRSHGSGEVFPIVLAKAGKDND
jgi:ATP-dependent DNA helicase RecQ